MQVVGYGQGSGGGGLLPHVRTVGVAAGAVVAVGCGGGAVGVAAGGVAVTIAVFVGTTAVGVPGSAVGEPP